MEKDRKVVIFKSQYCESIVVEMYRNKILFEQPK